MPVTLPTLTVQDNFNGTVTLTTSGGDAGATHAVKYADAATLGWVPLTTISGNASVTVPVDPGTHWWTAVSTVGAESDVLTPFLGIVSGAETSTYQRILEAVIGELQSLATAGSLPGLDSTKIARQDAVFVANLPFDLPGIVVAPGVNEEQVGGTNARDDFEYPVNVGILDFKWEKDPNSTYDYLLLRERIRRHFNQRRLALVGENLPEVYKCVVQFEGVLDYQAGPKAAEGDGEGVGHFGSYLTLIFTTRETRGA